MIFIVGQCYVLPPEPTVRLSKRQTKRAKATIKCEGFIEYQKLYEAEVQGGEWNLAKDDGGDLFSTQAVTSVESHNDLQTQEIGSPHQGKSSDRFDDGFEFQ